MSINTNLSVIIDNNLARAGGAVIEKKRIGYASKPQLLTKVIHFISADRRNRNRRNDSWDTENLNIIKTLINAV